MKTGTISRRPMNMPTTPVHSTKSGDWGVMTPMLTPTLPKQEANSNTASPNEHPVSVNTNEPTTNALAYSPQNTATSRRSSREHSSFLPKRTILQVRTPRRWPNSDLAIQTRLFAIISTRYIFMPPAVEPASEPTNMSRTSRNTRVDGSAANDGIVWNPVVVMIDTVWKTDVLRASPHELAEPVATSTNEPMSDTAAMARYQARLSSWWKASEKRPCTMRKFWRKFVAPMSMSTMETISMARLW